jgi:hypothetical protein
LEKLTTWAEVEIKQFDAEVEFEPSEPIFDLLGSGFDHSGMMMHATHEPSSKQKKAPKFLADARG